MIPRDYITEWRAEAPWVQDFQVEQDLVISRALVEIFSNPVLHDALAFRGGTALYAPVARRVGGMGRRHRRGKAFRVTTRRPSAGVVDCSRCAWLEPRKH